MSVLGRWVQRPVEWVAHVVRSGPAPAGPPGAGGATGAAADAPLVKCPACEGSGNCRVCGGAGTVDRLVAVTGADSSGVLAREPVQTMKTLKCRACPGSKGICRTCGGRGVVVDPAAG
ncbi:MAG TPA: hypothetical protein VK066_05430 [Chloroflexota bacterium]|nr:hypothetical protein [Chloroflexota bacterium]